MRPADRNRERIGQVRTRIPRPRPRRLTGSMPYTPLDSIIDLSSRRVFRSVPVGQGTADGGELN